MKRFVRALAGLAATVALAALAPPSTARAGQPERIQLDPLTLDLEGYCRFPVHFQEIAQDEVLTLYADGRASFTGRYKVRLTNSDTGASIDVNASGPWRISPTSFWVLGPELFGVTAAETGGPGFFLYYGRTTYTRDESGLINSITSSGTRSANLCDQLV